MENIDKNNKFAFPLGGLPDATYLYSNSVFIHSDAYKELAKKFSANEQFFYAKVKHVIVRIEHRNEEKLRNIVACGKVKKEQLKLVTGESVDFEFVPKVATPLITEITFQIITTPKQNIPEIMEEDLDNKLKSIYNNALLNHSDRLYIDLQLKEKPTEKNILILETLRLENMEGQPEQRGFILDDTTFVFKFSSSDIKIINTNKTKNIMKKGDFNFQEDGIGGLHEELNKIIRTAFVSRMHSSDTLKKFGIKHVKGILLYGPPGTGKTLIAKTLAKKLDAAECTVVNGPELFDKYVGETERKIRELFVKAEQDEKLNKENSRLHVIVFDEIDSICRTRGTISSGTGVHDSAVNQLLTKIDGVDSLNNILIIGMTNRKELIDEAILRPGRLEVHIEISLPSLKERVEIFNVHTKVMKDNNILDENLNIEELAKLAENFTGAEIETLVKRAASYAMNTFTLELLNPNPDDKSKPKEKKPKNDKNDPPYSKVTFNHFKYAFEEVKPMFGSDKQHLESSIKFGIINYGQRFANIHNQLISYVNQLKNSNSANIMSILLYGEKGNGKTSLACDVAMNSGYPYVKIISPIQLSRYIDNGKAQEIMNIFENAYKSPLSFIIIDNIERIIEYIKIGPRFSNIVLQTLLVYINKAPIQKDHKVFIIGTTNCVERLDDLELVSVFNHKMKIPNLNPNEIKTVVENYSDIDQNVSNEIYNLYKNAGKEIAIKDLLMTLDESVQVKGKDFTFKDFKEIYELKQTDNDYF